jgi:HK97 family phage prohead protease
MSSTLEEGGLAVADTQGVERAERPVLRREYAANIIRGDGRTVDVRIVPYGEVIEHNDGLGGERRGVTYREEFMPGVFGHQTNAAHRILANVEHQQGIGGLVARGVSVRDTPDGFHGTFRMLDGQDADKALELIDAGVLDGVSLEAAPVKNIRSQDGVVQRVKANLINIAFTRFAAYSGAKVLAVREDEPDEQVTIDAEFLPLELDPELVERCRQLGMKLPQRYEAHPDVTDTPAEPGTSEDGTRPDQANAEVGGTGDADPD